MVKLQDIMDTNLLEQHIANGLVTKRDHNDLPLSILKYTAAASYGNVWDSVTLNSRGLVYDNITGEIVGRPLAKFFNYNQPQAPVLNLDDPVLVMNKEDGSLITVFYYKGKIECASSGSFYSEQAIAARKMIADGVLDAVCDFNGYTLLFELVGPSNRIVLEYPKDELVLLGLVNNSTGKHLPPTYYALSGWTGGLAEIFEYETFGEALAAPPRPNAEGYVIKRGDDLVKFKQEDYIKLHALISNLSPKSVWEQLVAGKSLDEIKADLPDEFYGFVDETGGAILEKAQAIVATAKAEYQTVIKYFIDNDSRAEFAFYATKSDYTPYLFALLDGKDIATMALKACRPKVDTPAVV